MSKAWTQIDLEGAGLQEISLHFAQQMKRREKARALLLAFPLGLHRDYLDHPAGAWLYRIVFAAALASYFLWHRACIGGALLLLLTLAALYDLRWIEDRVASLNKTLRLETFRARTSTAPPGFRGRMGGDAEDTVTEAGLDDWLAIKERERGGHVRPGTDAAFNSESRAPSIARQEALLRELARRNRSGQDDPPPQT